MRSPALIALSVIAVLLANTGLGARAHRPPTPAVTDARPLTADDLRWLDRVTFGIDTQVISRYRAIGRSRFLEEQLHPTDGDAPDLTVDVAAITTIKAPAAALLKASREEQQRINALPEDERQTARMAANQAATAVLYDTTKRHLLRAIYSPTQLREQMTWFWVNHRSFA